MHTSKKSSTRTRVVLFGMHCGFTRPVLTALRTAPSIDLAAVVLAGSAASPASGPMADTIPPGHTPLIGIPDRTSLSTPDFRATMERIAPDVIIVACFPWRLPRWLLSLPPGGCVNVHPSLLPDGRGPDPVFWAFRWGLKETGVTLHLMDENFDTGPVISQRRLAIPEDATIPSLEQSLAGMGAGMVIEHLSIPQGHPVIASPQPKGPVRYARNPRQDDLTVSTSWSAPGAARFIQAVVPTYGSIPILILATGQRLMVDMVIRIDDHGSVPEPVVVDGDTATIQFAEGSLDCRIVRSRQMLQLHRPGGS